MSDQQNPATPEGTDASTGYTPEAEASLKSEIAALEAAASELKGAAKGVNTNQQKKLKAELVELLKLKPEGDTEGDGEDTPAQTATTTVATPTVTLSPDDVYVKTVIDNLPGAVIKANRNAAFDSPKIQREAVLYAREVAEANQDRLDEIDALKGEDKEKASAEFVPARMTMQELARRTGYEVNGAFRRRIRYLSDNGQIPVEPIDEEKVKKPKVVPATTPQASDNGTDATDDAQTPQEGQEGSQQATAA